MKKQPAKAAELFNSTCREMGLQESCLALGNMYMAGKGETQSILKSQAIFFYIVLEQAMCEMGLRTLFENYFGNDW